LRCEFLKECARTWIQSTIALHWNSVESPSVIPSFRVNWSILLTRVVDFNRFTRMCVLASRDPLRGCTE
jgi:hypothetical protein